ncbi:MAG: hypothetical protein ACI4Q4_06005 [Oscillospiraceae bacterium]
MNMISCAEQCRWQKDGLCTLCDLSRAAEGESRCRHFEKIQ